MMASQDWAREMARYNRWQNETLYGHCDALGDDARQQDRGMFFGSVIATLDHILMVDQALFDYFAFEKPPSGFNPNLRIYADWAQLREARAAFDDGLLTIIEDRPPDWLDEELPYTRPGWDHVAQVPRKGFAMQMFNHATHHRSQVTAELHRMGVDYGITDLPYNPLSQWWK